MFDPQRFQKCIFRDMAKPCLFVTFNVIRSYTFCDSFIEILQVVQKISRFSSSMVTILITLFTSPCHKTYDRWWQHFPTFNLLSKDCFTILQNYIDILLVLLKIWSGGVKLTPFALENLPSKSLASSRFTIFFWRPYK